MKLIETGFGQCQTSKSFGIFVRRYNFCKEADIIITYCTTVVISGDDKAW